MLDDETLLVHLEREVTMLGEAFAHGDPQAAVPGLSWDAQTVLTHTGAVHRWSADIVARRTPTNETGGSSAFWPSGADLSRLGAWFDEGAATLLSTLRRAPEDLSCYAFISGVAPRSFWIRRQAHETAVHRGDVETAGGRAATPVDAAFAQDGLAEVVGAFATEPTFASDRPGRLLLDATDGPAWLIVFGGVRNVVRSGDRVGAHADAVVHGTSAQLYRWAWNRPASVTTTGDRDVLACWEAVRI